MTGKWKSFASPTLLRASGAPLFLLEDIFGCIGCFEGIDSERGLEWRCNDSLSLRDFLKLEITESVPDHSTLSRMRSRFPLDIHEKVFAWGLEKLEQAGLISGRTLGVDASTMEANAAMKSIKRRDTAESYRQMLDRLAEESGVCTSSSEDLARMDKKRQSKKFSNKDWQSSTDPKAKNVKMKDGRTHLAYKPGHVMDLDSGAIVTAEIHPAYLGDTKTLKTTGTNLEKNMETPPCADDPADLVADKGHHSRELLKGLDGGSWKTRIAEPKLKGLHDWKDEHEAKRLVYKRQ